MKKYMLHSIDGNVYKSEPALQGFDFIQNIKSSNILYAGHQLQEDENTFDLFIQFKNGKGYRYIGVSAQVLKGLIDAESKGKYLSDKIIRQYAYSEVANKITSLTTKEIVDMHNGLLDYTDHLIVDMPGGYQSAEIKKQTE